ncbi:MAG TPA: FixH family protein [Myxococcota bacterium]|nr:FixH family protein [Myxococcota bacterium]
MACAACAAPPAAAPTSWRAVSSDGAIAGELTPENGSVVVGELQAWTVELRDRNGQPIRGAIASVGGGMPEHGHGLPTRPRVVAEVAPGRYRIEGLRLNMHGAWVIEVLVDSPQGAGLLRFPVRAEL